MPAQPVTCEALIENLSGTGGLEPSVGPEPESESFPISCGQIS